MAEPPPRIDDDTTMPRWVKLSAIAGVVILALLGVMLLAGHGPGQHMHSPAAPSGSTPG
jgi:hypothetical protein